MDRMLVETTFHITASGRVANVQQWTSALGFSPHFAAKRGELSGTAPSVDSWWAYVLEKRKVSNAEEPLKELLNTLSPHARAISKLVSDQDLEISVTSYIWEPVQGLAVDLSPATLKKLSALNCSYSVVVYE